MKNEITYHEENGYLYPDLALPKQKDYPISKYGKMHLAYLKEHRRGTYSHLLTSGTLNEYLHKIDEQAQEMLRSTLINRLAAERGINEALKAENGLLWVQEMNNCKEQAEEVVVNDLICI